MKLSVVIPIKDERENLRPLREQLMRALGSLGIDFEIVFVDDGSGDGSFTILTAMAEQDSRIKVVGLRRNFGQSAAMKAGIDWSTGDVIVTMDGDMQNDAADIPMLLARLDEGYDAVLGLRAKRQDHLIFRKVPSLIANWLIRKVTGTPIRDLGCTLRAMRRELAEALPLYGEMHRFVPVLAQQYGARIVQVPVKHHPRRAGKTKYTITRTFRVLLDLITVQFLHSYLTRPMHVLGLGGLVSMALGLVSLLATIWMKSRYGTFMTGNPLLLLSVMLELVGVQFISLGLISEIMMRTYFESQGKAAYAVKKTINIDAPAARKAA
jgi:glycosyltransferase involved in cell wall biosynthesis